MTKSVEKELNFGSNCNSLLLVHRRQNLHHKSHNNNFDDSCGISGIIVRAQTWSIACSLTTPEQLLRLRVEDEIRVLHRMTAIVCNRSIQSWPLIENTHFKTMRSSRRKQNKQTITTHTKKTEQQGVLLKNQLTKNIDWLVDFDFSESAQRLEILIDWLTSIFL